MKTLRRFTTFWIVFSTIIIGCKEEKTLKDNELSFNTYKIEKKQHLFNDTANAACNFQLTMVFPDKYPNEDVLKKIQKEFITTFIGDKYGNLPPKEAADKYEADYIADYLSLENIYKEEPNNIGAWMNYEQILDNKILFNKNDFLSYGVNLYTFTGGAHGMSSTVFQVLNLKTASPVKLNDIFEDRNLDKVGELIRMSLAKKLGYNSVTKLEDDGYDVSAIVPTENFYINEEGITWLYNPYEIAAYVVGKSEVLVDYADLLIYINEDSAVYPLAKIAIK